MLLEWSVKYERSKTVLEVLDGLVARAQQREVLGGMLVWPSTEKVCVLPLLTVYTAKQPKQEKVSKTENERKVFEAKPKIFGAAFHQKEPPVNVAIISVA